MQPDRTDVAYRVRIEAEGYRSAMSDAVRPGTTSTSISGWSRRRRYGAGSSTRRASRSGARVYLATGSQILGTSGTGTTMPGRPPEGRSPTARAVFLPRAVRALAVIGRPRRGYAEANSSPTSGPATGAEGLGTGRGAGCLRRAGPSPRSGSTSVRSASLGGTRPTSRITSR